MNKIFSSLPLVLTIQLAAADSRPALYHKITTSERGACYLMQIPPSPSFVSRGKIYEEVKPSGTAYHLKHDGSTKKLWQIQWYAYKVYLSVGCEYLIRMGDWAVGSEPEKTDLAVAFYKKGKLLKQYSTADLIKNKQSVKPSVSHYLWQANDDNYPALKSEWFTGSAGIYSGTFQLITIENILYSFDVTTGDIIKKSNKITH